MNNIPYNPKFGKEFSIILEVVKEILSKKKLTDILSSIYKTAKEILEIELAFIEIKDYEENSQNLTSFYINDSVPITTLLVDQDNVFFAINKYREVFKSENAGVTWNKILEISTFFKGAEISPSNDSTIVFSEPECECIS